jgi:hypothetical protein
MVWGGGEMFLRVDDVCIVLCVEYKHDTTSIMS